MDRALVQDYLEKSGMNELQAEALSRIFGEMATRSDVELLRHELNTKLESYNTKLESLKSDLTLRMLAGIVAMATLVSLLDALIA